MIEPKDFYSNEDYPGKVSKFKMWRRILKGTSSERKTILGGIELKSFTIGIATAVILFFTITGIYATFSKAVENKLPDNIKINNAYRNAIDDFEKALPIALAGKERTVKVDDWISSRTEEMHNLNTAIFEISDNSKTRDYSPLKQKRLREFYRLKLKIIDEIIELEEIENEITN